MIDYLDRLLRAAQTEPDAALARMNANRGHPERLFRICSLRIAPRLLQRWPEPVLESLFYFLRRGPDGQPAEHQNLRRPVSRALPEILELLARTTPELKEKIC